MSLFGVERRRHRLEGGAGRIFLLALDHGVAAGPVPGIERPTDLVRRLRSAPFSGLLVNPGMVRLISANIAPAWGLIVHLSAGTLLSSRPGSKVLSSTVEHAVSLGADAVSVQISFGDSGEDRMIADAGHVVKLATSLGLPVFSFSLSTMALPPDPFLGSNGRPTSYGVCGPPHSPGSS